MRTKGIASNQNPKDSIASKLLKLIDLDEVVAFLQSLIQAQSDHPPGDCRQVIQLVQEKIDGSSIKSKIYARQDHQPNLVACYPHKPAKPSLLFHAHADTVPAGDLEQWHHHPYQGIVQDGKIYGRGAGDDKGSIAAQVMAMVTLARSEVNFNGQLQVAVVSDEESGGLNGTRWLHQDNILAPDALVVGEQTQNHIALAERVACGIDLTVFGKSAHGAMPWAGENAVLKAAGAVKWLQENYFPKLAARNHPYLPPPTLSIGKITGGIQWSIVPEHCKIEMDRRLIPGETRESAMDELKESLDEYHHAVENLAYELFSTGEVAANIETPPDDPFAAMAHQALADLTGSSRPFTGYALTSDGRWFARDGIPIIIFGPGDPALAHSTNEFIEIDQLIEATQVYTLLAARFLNQTPAA